MKPPRYIFLDFGDTLVVSEPLYVERLRLSFEREGAEFTYEEMERAFIEADWRTALALVDRKPFPVDGWRELFMAVMLQILKVKSNSKDYIQRVADRMTEIKPRRTVMEGAVEFLAGCRRAGIKTAILSNNDGRTVAKAAEVGIDGYFDLVVDSTLEGTAKPDPLFFNAALDHFGARPSDCLHVGDLLGCDVVGAHAAGIPAAWFNQRSYTPEAPIRPELTVDGFGSLAEAIGVKLNI